MPSHQGACRRAAALAAVLFSSVALPPSATAVEYRLQVVSVYEESFAALLRRGELAYGASGPGLDRLEASLDRGEFPRGAALYDRAPRAVSAALAQAHGAAPVRAEHSGDGGPGLWHEVRWDGRPDEQTVWRVVPTGLRHAELDRVALKGRGPLRQFLPFSVAARGHRGGAVSVPLGLLSAQEERGMPWTAYLSGVLDLSEGIAALIGVNASASFPDHVYLIVRHGKGPATYKAVLGWRPRHGSHLNDIEAPGGDHPR
jgi:hypothetical protein